MEGKHRLLPKRQKATVLRKEFGNNQVFIDYVRTLRASGRHVHIAGVGSVEGFGCHECANVTPYTGDL